MEENDKIVENSWTDPITGKFVKGNPGKPKGTIHKPKLIDEIEKELDKMAEGKDYTYRVALMRQILKKMILEGDTRIMTEYWQQRDGKPRQSIGVDGGEDGKPVIFQVAKEIAQKNDISTSSTENNSE